MTQFSFQPYGQRLKQIDTYRERHRCTNSQFAGPVVETLVQRSTDCIQGLGQQVGELVFGQLFASVRDGGENCRFALDNRIFRTR